MGTLIIGGLFVMFAVYSLASAGGVFASRAGIVNYALNGAMIMGATGYILASKALVALTGGLEWYTPIVSLLVAMIFSILTTSLLSFTAINLGSDHLIVGMAVNILAPIISLVLIVFITKGHNVIDIKNIQITHGFAKQMGMETWEIQLIIAAVVGIIIISLIVLLKNSTLGIRIRAAGENPHALASAGVSVLRIKHIAMIFSGALAGLAGGVLVGALPKFEQFDSSVYGIGFIAISILIIGRWRMEFTIITSFLLAIIYVLINTYAPDFGQQNQWYLHMVPYLATLVILPFFVRFSQRPKALGVQFRNSRR